jgi:hypothetical protein
MSHEPTIQPDETDLKRDVLHVENTDVEADGKPVYHSDKVDDVAYILDQAAGEQIEISEQDRKRILRKIDLWVCVPLCIVYTIQSLDKVSSYPSGVTKKRS